MKKTKRSIFIPESYGYKVTVSMPKSTLILFFSYEECEKDDEGNVKGLPIFAVEKKLIAREKNLLSLNGLSETDVYNKEKVKISARKHRFKR